MLEKRKFHIVWIQKNHGVEVAPAPDPDKTVTYTGEKLAIEK